MCSISRMIDRIVELFFTVNRTGFTVTAFVLFVLEAIACFGIIHKVPYTEIDWSTYMQQVECYLKKNELNYSRIEGDTGPVVYPAGHLIVYRIFYALTNSGKDIRMGQYIFMALYLLNLFTVFRIYWKSRRMPAFVLIFLTCTGYRIHSIFVLRLFNDPLAMLLFYIAVNMFVSQRWLLGCVLYSTAVSIKMNVLLFAPALFFLLLLNGGVFKTMFHLAVCAGIQFYAGLPFLLHDHVAYLKRSFDLGRIFLFKWTVNWRFLPEALFLDRRFHIVLLALHLLVLVIFGYTMWFRSHGGLRASLRELYHGIRTRIGVAEAMFALFTANLIGITFSRSLHYQFYSWYFHQLPFLMFYDYPVFHVKGNENTAPFTVPWLSIIFKGLLLLLVEYCWNVYPSTVLSSALLHVCHAIILVYLVLTRASRPQKKFKVY